MRVFLSFLATFGTVRLVTHGIRGGWLPLRNIEVGGGADRQGAPPLHLHHLVLGILSLTGAGYLALTRTDHSWRRRLAPWYGAGVALTFDEFALWLHLRDDYWSQEGRTSVDAVVALAASFGLLAGSPMFWNRALGEVLASPGHGADPVPEPVRRPMTTGSDRG
ncbi:MAG TPA: hypothetical protein VMW47_08510 [Verrucomicrobiae bacterium]|nr:hypothetical protein [Verrucomicrobiae bacterium]